MKRNRDVCIILQIVVMHNFYRYISCKIRNSILSKWLGLNVLLLYGIFIEYERCRTIKYEKHKEIRI